MEGYFQQTTPQENSCSSIKAIYLVKIITGNRITPLNGERVNCWCRCVWLISTASFLIQLYISSQEDGGYSWVCVTYLMETRLCCCSVTQLCPTLCNPMNCSTPGFPVLHHLPELAQIHVHWVGDAIQPSRSLSSPSPAFNPSQHQGSKIKDPSISLFQWVGSLYQVAKVLEFQLQHQSFQWIFRVDFL